jgi:hypothetical protein
MLHPPRVHAALRRLLALATGVASLSFLGASCGQSALGVLPGVLNDTRNLSLRKSILAYGMSRVCDEVRSRSMPLRFADEDPVMGRFFPSRCTATELPNGDLSLQFGGLGYVWTEMSLRLGFEAGAAVAYETDFILDGSTMYVYFRPRPSAPPAFTTRVVEQQQAALFSVLAGKRGGLNLPDSVGTQIMAAQLARGFTVIRDAGGGVDFGLGVVPPGARPAEAYAGLDHSRPILANERVDVHQNQRDFAGPFEVPPGKELGLLVNVAGAPAVDVLVVPRAVGDAWLATYTSELSTTAAPGPALLDEVVATGTPFRRAVALPAGSYYLVLDNTPTAGRTSLPTAPRDDHAAVVSYAVDVE